MVKTKHNTMYSAYPTGYAPYTNRYAQYEFSQQNIISTFVS